MHRRSEIGRGVLALVLLGVLVVGVPAGLVHFVGWPLPTRLPTGRQISDALTRDGVGDGTIVKLVACVLWFAWIQLAVSVAVEVVSLARHRSVRAVRGLGPFRHLAATLVAAVTVLFTSVAVLAPPAGARPAPAVVARTHPAAAPAAPRLDAAATVGSGASGAAAEPEVPLPTYAVRPRDTLWGIAEQTLGRGERWAEIRQLNLGREVAPGVRFTAHTELIRPGWRLLLPADAAPGRVESVVAATPAGPPATAPTATTAPTAPAPVPAPAPAPTTVVVRPGDTLTHIAQRVLGDASRWRTLWDANRGRTFGARRFDHPDLIQPGWSLVVPSPAAAAPVADPAPPAASPVAAPAPAAPPTASTPATAPVPPVTVTVATSTAPATPAMPAPSPAPAIDGHDERPLAAVTPAATPASNGGAPPAAADHTRVGPPAAAPDWLAPTGLAGATLLATGLAGLLGSRRRHRLRSMGRDDVLPFPDPDLASVDAAIRVGADALTMARIDVALRALAAGLGRPPEGRGQRPVVVLRHDRGDLEVVLTHPVGAVAPVPWEPGDDSRRLVLRAAVPLSIIAEHASPCPAPCPALVLLGRSAGAHVYLDLEAAGIVAIEGPPAVARSLARAVMACLAVSPLADVITVVATGFDCYGLGDEERVQPVDDPTVAVTRAASLAAGVREALASSGCRSTYGLRVAQPHEPWEPVVLVAAGADVTAAGLDLAALVGRGGLAVVADHAPPDTTWRLAAAPARGWRLEPLGLDIVPTGLTDDELADVGALLADAAAPPVHVEPRTAVSEPAPPAPAPVAAAVAAPYADPDWSLLVRVLGPVDVVDLAGTPAEFERAKALELAVWLAQHRANPTRVAARTALWEIDVRDATFANVVSDARRGLARLVSPPDGEDWIARNQGERIPLHRLVVTDADLLAARLDHARTLPADEARACLRVGLDLVRDLPYAGTSYLWPDGQGLPSQLTLLVTNAATDMAGHCLALGDVDGVFWATGQGLKALPGHDELVCLRMRAHARQGNLAGVRHEFESYQRVVLADPWESGLSRKVVQLRAELLSAPPP